MPARKKRRKYDAPLDSGRARTVQSAVTLAEHAAVRAAYPAHGEVSTLLRETIERMALDLDYVSPPSDGDRKYLSAQLQPDEIATISAAANACGLEPTVLLRIAVLCRARVGTGEALWNVLKAVRR